MKKILYLISKKFPFGVGEEFLENEIDIISAAFDEIYVVAVGTNRNDILTRKVPQNVSVFRHNDITTEWKYLYYILYSFRYFCSDEFQSELRLQKGIKAKLVTCYFFAKVKSIEESCLKLLNQIRLKQDDIMIFYSYWFVDTSLVATNLRDCIKGRVKNAKAISRAHGYDLYEDRTIAKAIPFREMTLERIDSVYPCSKDGADYLTRRYPSFSSKINPAYLGTRDFGRGESSSDGYFRIVTCSAISPLKRIALVAKAIALLEKRKITTIIWHCIGDGPELNIIKKSCNKTILINKIIFHGRKTNAEVMQLYQTVPVDLFINVSTSEGLPVSIMEAQSFGIPVLATDVGGTSEIVLDGITGFLLPASVDEETVANKVLYFLSQDVDDIYNMRLHSRRNWVDNFNSTVNYQKFIENL